MTTEPSALIFMDTETTGLSLTDDIWEFAAVRREPDGTEVPSALNATLWSVHMLNALAQAGVTLPLDQPAEERP